MKKLTALLAAALICLAGTAVAKDEKKAATPAATPAAAAKAAPMDINSATEAELAMLKGVGEARAKAIIKGRPYKGKNDLLNKKILPENIYNDVKDLIIAKQAAKK